MNSAENGRKPAPTPENIVSTSVNCPTCGKTQDVQVNTKTATLLPGTTNVFAAEFNCSFCSKPMVVAVNQNTGEGLAHSTGMPF